VPRRPRSGTAPADSVATLQGIAKALGISVQAVSAYRAAGCVVGKAGAWSVSGTYRAAKAAGYQPRLPHDHALAALCGVGDAGGMEPASGLPGRSEYDDLILSKRIDYKTAIAREELIGEELANVRRRVDADTARGNVLPIDEARKAAALVRDRFVSLGLRLPAAVIGYLPDAPQSVLQSVMIAVEKSWADGLADIDG